MTSFPLTNSQLYVMENALTWRIHKSIRSRINNPFYWQRDVTIFIHWREKNNAYFDLLHYSIFGYFMSWPPDVVVIGIKSKYYKVPFI